MLALLYWGLLLLWLSLLMKPAIANGASGFFLIAIISNFVANVLHGFSHAVAASFHRLNFSGITVFAFGTSITIHGFDELGLRVYRGKRNILIVGPLSNLVLATLALVCILVFADMRTLVADFMLGYLGIGALKDHWVALLFIYCGYTNFLKGLFDLMPVSFLDGGRLSQLSWRKFAQVDSVFAWRRMVGLSRVLGWASVSLAVLLVPMSMLMGVLVDWFGLVTVLLLGLVLLSSNFILLVFVSPDKFRDVLL